MDETHVSTEGTTNHLLAQHRAGDSQAFASLFTRFRPVVERYLLGRIHKVFPAALRPLLEADLDDLVQLVMIDAETALRVTELKGPLALLKWLETVALNKLRDHKKHMRRGKRDRLREVRFAMHDSTTGAVVVADGGSGVATRLAVKDERRKLASALLHLPARSRRILIAIHALRLPMKEVALEVGAASAEALRKECERKILRSFGNALIRCGYRGDAGKLS